MNHLLFTNPARYNNDQILESDSYIKDLIREEAKTMHNGDY